VLRTGAHDQEIPLAVVGDESRMEAGGMRKDGLSVADFDEAERAPLGAVADDGDTVGGKRKRKGIADGRRRSGQRTDVFEFEFEIADRSRGCGPLRVRSSWFLVRSSFGVQGLRTQNELRTKN